MAGNRIPTSPAPGQCPIQSLQTAQSTGPLQAFIFEALNLKIEGLKGNPKQIQPTRLWNKGKPHPVPLWLLANDRQQAMAHRPEKMEFFIILSIQHADPGHSFFKGFPNFKEFPNYSTFCPPPPPQHRTLSGRQRGNHVTNPEKRSVLACLPGC